MNPVFADYMQAYGRAGLKALRLGHLRQLARLYWYTVEFGLITTPEGLRIYGSGILSSAGESIYCLEDKRPHRMQFDLRRVMRTQYRIDRYQQTYFVIDGFGQLFAATQPDFAPIYREIGRCRKSRLMRYCLMSGAGPSGNVRTERPFATEAAASAKKKGRALARPEFREETPRRRTAKPPEVIHAAAHKIMIVVRKSTPVKISVAALGISHGSGGSAQPVLCSAQTVGPLRRSVPE